MGYFEWMIAGVALIIVGVAVFRYLNGYDDDEVPENADTREQILTVVQKGALVVAGLGVFVFLAAAAWGANFHFGWPRLIFGLLVSLMAWRLWRPARNFIYDGRI